MKPVLAAQGDVGDLALQPGHAALFGDSRAGKRA
jgi:hypothetical protein